MDFPPLIEQLCLRSGWSFAPAGASLGHIGELEATHRNPACGKAFSHFLHERTVHRRASAMGQNQARASRALRPIPTDGMPFAALCVLIRVNTSRLPFPHPCLAFY